ncbi:MAG: hypothetical protein IPH37_14655 [Burkholderiales bacterium]|nr:hypothetical protein [Burkholderiales bacterium]
MEAGIATGVDNYLDWYFSIGADYARLAMMLTGDVDQFLESKFHEIVMENLQQDDAFKKLQGAHEDQWLQLHQTSGGIQKILSENHISIVDRGCRVVSDTSLRTLTLHLDEAKTRLSASAAAGMVGGVFASKLVAKVMSKSSMKFGGKVLLKAVAKKAAGKAGGAAAGLLLVPLLGQSYRALAL